MAKAAAAAQEERKAVNKDYPPPKRSASPQIDQVKASTEPQSTGRATREARRQRKAPNVDAMRNTLAALKNEQSSLKERLQNNAGDEDTQFDLDLVSKNISTL